MKTNIFELRKNIKKSPIASLIFAIGLFTLTFACVNYPLFSKGFSFAIVFGSFVMVIFSGASILYPTDEKIYETFEKEEDEKQTEEGVFSYNSKGFSFSYKHEVKHLQWNEIIRISSITVRFVKETQPGILIETEENQYEFLEKYVSGIPRFLSEAEKHLPLNIPDETSIQINNRGENRVVLYSKTKSIS